MSHLSLLLYLMSELLLLISCQRYIVASGIHQIYSPSADEQIVTAKLSTILSPIFASKQLEYKYLASLTSINSETTMLVDVISLGTDTVDVRISGWLTAFSYMIFKIVDYVTVDSVTLYFPKPRFQNSGESIAYLYSLKNKIPANYPNYIQIDPFLTEIVSTGFQQQISDVSVEGIKGTGILVKKTNDITKISISYVIHPAAQGMMHVEFAPLNTLQLLEGEQLQFWYLPFIGIKRIARQIGFPLDSGLHPKKIPSPSSFKPIFISQRSFAESYFLDGWSRKCQMIDVRNGTSSYYRCTRECNESLQTLLYFVKFCYTPNYTPDVPHGNSIKIPGCALPTFYQNEITCNTCRSQDNFVYNKGGYCQCRQGFYQPIHDIELDACLPCTEQSCPTFFQISFGTSSSNYSSCSVNLTISNNLDMVPENNDYRQLQMEISINNKVIEQTQTQWTHNNQYNVMTDECQYADSYLVLVKTLNRVDVVQKDRTYKTLLLTRSKNFKRNGEEKVLVIQTMQHSSAQAVKNYIPAAAFILSLLSTQIDLLSFLQVSTLFYASSMIQWPAYASNIRIAITKAVFRFEPMNMFTVFGVAGFIKQPRSDDNPRANAMLRLFQSRLYVQIAGQMLITLLIQVLLIEIILRLLRALLPTPFPEQREYRIDANDNITWKKRTFLTALIQDKDLSLLSKLGLIVDRVYDKRLVFYHNFILSQIVFHSFVIFGQLTLSVTTLPELYSTCLALFVLSALVAFPVFVSRNPLLLFKCAGIVYKKREYSTGKLIIFTFYNFWELIALGASVSLFDNHLHQSIGFTVLAWVKLWLMQNDLKRLELVKAICIALFASLLCFGGFFHHQNILAILEYVCIGLMMTVCAVQLFKILRAVVIAILSLFKSPASERGQRIIDRIKHYRQENESNMILHRQ